MAYSRRGLIATAAFAGSVHAVVVQMASSAPAKDGGAPGPGAAMGSPTHTERLTCPSGYSSSASASAVRDEGDQCTGLRPRYTCPLRQSAPKTRSWAASYSGSRVRYGAAQSPNPPYRSNWARCVATVASAYSRALDRSVAGVSARRSSDESPCSTLSSIGSPWQSHPGT